MAEFILKVLEMTTIFGGVISAILPAQAAEDSKGDTDERKHDDRNDGGSEGEQRDGNDG